MECLICRNNSLVPILNRKPVKIWLNAADSSKNSSTFECKLYQCNHCTHAQQNPSKELEFLLNKVYNSEDAQASTQMGFGNWGKRRANDVLRHLSFNNSGSALEIGCAGGYILWRLKELGFRDLVGIDPSVKSECHENGIRLINGYVKKGLNLHKKFNLILSICVFEHIKNLDEVLQFVRNHLNDNGELFFEVPNFDNALKKGDPIVFLHEHIHYFTESSLKFLLSKNGLCIKKIKKVRDSFFVSAYKKDNFNIVFPKTISLYSDYETRLDKVIRNISSISTNKMVAFHGVCNTLNNILGWGDIKTDFGLFDNDDTKTGKTYFGKTVYAPSTDLINKYNVVIVVPTIFLKEIKQQYKKLGFRGRIEGII